MDKNAIKNKLKAIGDELNNLFKFNDEAPQEDNIPVEPKEYSLKDGQKVYITDLAESGVVTVVEGDAQVPAKPGEYVLVDDTVITVADSGVIETVKSPEAPTDTVSKDLEEMKAAFTALKEQFEAHLQKVNAQENKWNTEKAKFSEQINNQKSTISELAGIIEQLIDEPSEDPVDEAKDRFSHVESRESRNARFRERCKNLSN